MSEIDLSPDALQKRREIAEKANYDDWYVEEDLSNADQFLTKMMPPISPPIPRTP